MSTESCGCDPTYEERGVVVGHRCERHEAEREAGVAAIIALQAAAGIEEPRERAERNWDMFSASERAFTMAAYQVVIGATH